MNNALIIDEKDNVAVAIEPIRAGQCAVYSCKGGDKQVTVLEDITIYHKIAIRDIPQGGVIVKYGEHIGLATQAIKAGEHVHVHNVEGHREDLAAKG